MNSETVAAVRDFSLKARALLENEVGEQLEGVYGWLPDGKLEPAEKYPAIQELDEARKVRRGIDRFLSESLDAGVKRREARDDLLREAAFTWLNRLVAFKMLEARNLIRQSISKGVQSRGFLLWLTEPGNEELYAKHEQGDLPQNRLGEGPRQEAYRQFILFQCGKLAQEIRVLFNPENLASRFFPRPPALQQLIPWMNEPTIKEAWAPGNEETIGWVYQYFSSEELERAFREVRLSGKKFEAKDIPSVTQLFTPRWIVRYLVENTLGRLWIEMHPDSKLKEELDYLMPFEASRSPKVKPVRQIRLLDPACGTMHFGLVAFDLFEVMYREEVQWAGNPGWPKKASVDDVSEIGPAIIANNLHGIDIDTRAVQLSALTVYLRAKSLNPAVTITESRLASGCIHKLGLERLDSFLDKAGIRQPIYRRVLKSLLETLQDSEQLGSMLRLEEVIHSLVAAERERFIRDGQQLDIAGWALSQFGTEAGQKEFWEILAVQIEQALNLFIKSENQALAGQSFFAGETVKGLRLLELLSSQYDVVVTNPPYMSTRKMNNRLKTLVGKHYPDGKGDLYAAFIERCLELTASSGRVGMLTMHSFMFISSYEKLRSKILGKACIDTLAHLGPGLFAVGNPGTLQTAAHAVCVEPEAQKRNEAVGTYVRLVKEPDCDSKRRRFESALEALKSGQGDPLVFRYRQGDFDAIPGSPWVYWISPGVHSLFENLPKLRDVSLPRHGLSTCDNSRFLRKWWEVGRGSVYFDCRDTEETLDIVSKWYPYMKGGSFKRWFGNQDHVVNWQQDGREIKTEVIARFPYLKGNWGLLVTNPAFYFKKGITWTDLTSGRFSARLSPGGFIFDVKGSSAFPEDIPLVLGLLNSSFAHYVLSLINPTVSFQVGDLSRLPVPQTSSNTLRDLVNTAVELAKQTSAESETTYDFIAPPDWSTGTDFIAERAVRLSTIEQEIDEEVYRLYGISEEDRRAIERELADKSSELADEAGGTDVAESVSEVDQEGESENHVTSPDTIPIESPLTREDLAREWISYAAGIVLGRFAPGVENGLGRGRFSQSVVSSLQNVADPDGILVMDEGHQDDLPEKLLEALNVMVGVADTTDLIRSATGKEGAPEDLLRQYLDRTFFKLHIQQYRKRPVYWYLQSPKKRYGIWVFHERLTNDSLFRIQKEYVEPKINHLEAQIADLRTRREGAQGRERREIEKTMASLSDILDDVREFQKTLERIIQERGYRPQLDDGVLLNMAPLWELIPSWQAEPKKAWQALERGDYDWSYQAMDHWPDRVREKCKTNKSFAIAHGLELM